jgi:hypothetical protein
MIPGLWKFLPNRRGSPKMLFLAYMKKLIILFILCLLPVTSWGEDAKEPSGDQKQEASKQDEPPKADSVWGALRYTGWHIEKGSVKAGSEIKKGSIKAGKTMEKGFKKAGSEIKDFFVGDDD